MELKLIRYGGGVPYASIHTDGVEYPDAILVGEEVFIHLLGRWRGHYRPAQNVKRFDRSNVTLSPEIQAAWDHKIGREQSTENKGEFT